MSKPLPKHLIDNFFYNASTNAIADVICEFDMGAAGGTYYQLKYMKENRVIYITTADLRFWRPIPKSGLYKRLYERE